MFGAVNVSFTNVAFADVTFVNVVFANVAFFVNNDVSAVDRVVDMVADRVEDKASFDLVVIKSSKGRNSSSSDNRFKVVVSNGEIGEIFAFIVMNIGEFVSGIILSVCDVVDKFFSASCARFKSTGKSGFAYIVQFFYLIFFVRILATMPLYMLDGTFTSFLKKH